MTAIAFVAVFVGVCGALAVLMANLWGDDE